MGLERFAPASRAPNPLTGRTRQHLLVTQFLTPTANRPLPQACGLGHHLDPAVPQFDCFAGPPVATSLAAQWRRPPSFSSASRRVNFLLRISIMSLSIMSSR